MDALPLDKKLLTHQRQRRGKYCNRLFLLERKYNGKTRKGDWIAEPLTQEQHYNERQMQSKHVLDEFFTCVEGFTVSCGTKLAKAVSYAKSEKKYLEFRFLESEELSSDNNRAETQYVRIV